MSTSPSPGEITTGVYGFALVIIIYHERNRIVCKVRDTHRAQARYGWHDHNVRAELNCAKTSEYAEQDEYLSGKYVFHIFLCFVEFQSFETRRI